MSGDESKKEDLRWLADVYEQAQEMRKAMDNRVRAREEGEDEEGDDSFAKNLADRFYSIETDTFRQMKKEAKKIEVYKSFLEKVRGIGPTYTTKLLAWIDIKKADNPSSIVKYCGLAVEMVCDNCGAIESRKPLRKKDMTDEEYEEIINEYKAKKRLWQGVKDGDACPECGSPVHGEAQKKRAGMPLGYNPKLKSLLWNIGNNFLRNNSPYALIYYKEKQEKRKNNWGENDQHRHLHALRKMEKIYLTHLWREWRKTEGLSIRDPYVIEHTEHNDYYEPEEFINMDQETIDMKLKNYRKKEESI